MIFQYSELQRTVSMSGSILCAIIGFIVMFTVGMYLHWRQLAFFGIFIHFLTFFGLNNVRTADLIPLFAKFKPKIHTITRKLLKSPVVDKVLKFVESTPLIDLLKPLRDTFLEAVSRWKSMSIFRFIFGVL